MFTYSSHYTIKRNKSSQVHKENKLYIESEILQLERLILRGGNTMQDKHTITKNM